MLFILLTACDFLFYDDGPGCYGSDGYSLMLNLVDESNQPVLGAEVSYAVDGGAEQDCIFDGYSWICGWEETGNFEVWVDVMTYSPETLEYTIGADSCHVLTARTTVMLTSLECTEETLPTATLNVSNAAGEPVGEADVSWMRADSSDAGSCGGADGQWTCEQEVAGDLVFTVEATGFEIWSEAVRVEHDGCHPLTVELEAALTEQ